MQVNGAELRADPSGALYWPARNLLVAADLHFEKGTALAARGAGLLPPYDTAATIAALQAAIARGRPATVICLGDSFHDGGAEARLDAGAVAALRALTDGVDWIWIVGNHDPAPPTRFGGRRLETLALDPLHFRHDPVASGPRAGPRAGEVAGHLHPKAAVRRRGKRIARRCFATDGMRLVLPAFGAYAGGLDVLDVAFWPIFGGGFHAWMLGRDRVYPVASRNLVAISRPRPWLA